MAYGDIQVTEPDSWPVSAILAIRPDWILISPEPDRHFRWRDLKSFPVSIAGLGPLGPAVMLATLKEHGVPTVQWNVLSLARAQKLFLAHRLPLLLLPLLPAEELVSSGSAHIVQYVAASTGPMPIWVIKGLKEENRTFLAAINQGLTYIRTHSANQIADLVRPDYPGVPPVALKAAIAEMQGLGVLPLSTYLDPNTYQAGADFLVNADVHWPDYSSAVDWHQARDALALAP